MLEKMKVKKFPKNGKVELLRFVFCIAVLLFHCEKYVMGEPSLENGIHLSLFCHGSMGVEFFFVLSGLLMAKSAYKKQDQLDGMNLAEDCVGFMKRKVSAIWSKHAISFVLVFIAYVTSCRFGWVKMIEKAIESIPSFFLIQMSGINLCSPNHVTWYISCMLIAMAILYPLCVKYYKMFTRYIAPLSAILILGYCVASTGRLTGVSVWTGICYKSMLRAVSEISLGACGFEISRWLEKYIVHKRQRIAATLLELSLFAAVMGYMIGTFPAEWEVIELLAIFALVVLAFSEVGVGSECFHNAICEQLGKWSLPLYLVQLVPIYLITSIDLTWSNKIQIVAIVVGTFAVAGIVMGIDCVLKRRK